MRKKILSIFLVLCMVCTMLPVSAKAEEEHTTMETLTDTGTDVITDEESIQDTGSPDEESIQDTGSPGEDMEATVIAYESEITATSSAATSYGVWVGGVEVTSENMRSVTGSAITGIVTYNPSTNTLTLDGANITGACDIDGNSYGIYSTGNLRINSVNNDNIVDGRGLNNQIGDSAGINVIGNLTIFSSGTKSDLDVYGGEASNGFSYGIRVGNNLTVSRNVSAYGGTARDASHGFSLPADNAIMTVNSEWTWVTAIGGISADSYGIFLEGNGAKLIINNNFHMMIRGSSATNMSCGIFLKGLDTQLTVDSGSLSSYGGEAINDSYGILTNGSIDIKGKSSVSASSNSADRKSCGIYTNEITMDGGGARVYSETATDLSCGIYTNEITINSGDVYAYCDSASDLSYGIYTNNITINGGTVKAASDSESREYQAISQAPTFGSDYIPTYYAGTKADDAKNVSDIRGYQYVEIEPYAEYDIWVGKERVTSNNRKNITGEGITGHITYEPSWNTLTLNNATISEAHEDAEGNMYGIYASNGLGLRRIGENNIFVQGPLEDNDGTGIYANVYLSIEGTGKLEVTGGAPTGDHGNSYGIHVENGYLSVEGGELIATGAPAFGTSSFSHGIGIHDGYMYISQNGSVTAEGAESDSASYGVYLGGDNAGLTVNDGSRLIATGGVADKVSYGIHFAKEISYLSVSGSVTAMGGSSVDESCGILAGEVSVYDGATLEASGGSATDGSFGIISDNISIYGGRVEADSGVANSSRAMSSAPTFDRYYDHINNAGNNAGDARPVTDEELAAGIDNYKYIKIEPVTEYDVWVGDIRVTSANQDLITCEGITGIITYDPDSVTLTLDNVRVYDHAYIDDNGNRYGIYAIGDMNLKLRGDSSIGIPGNDEDTNGTGIYVTGNLTISGEGKFVVTGGLATAGDHGDSYGIHIEDGDLTVMGGELIAAGAPAAGSSSGSYGICVHNGNLIIKNNGKVTATGEESERVSFGVYLGGENTSLTVESGSSLEATSGATDGDSFGIYFLESSTQLTVNGGILTAISGSATGESYGVSVGKVIINGGKVKVDSGAADRSQAMSSAPTFGSGYLHRNKAGSNASDATYVTDGKLVRSINDYRYIEITPYTPIKDNGGGSYTPAPTPTTKPIEPMTATVDSRGTANIRITEQYITDAISNAKAEAEKNGKSSSEIKVVIHVSTDGSEVSNFNINLPKATIKLLIDSNIAGIELVIDNPDITVGINQSALMEINKQANADVQINVTRTDSSKLSTAARKVIGRRPVYVFEASYQNGNKKVTNFGVGMIYVSIPYTPASNEVEGYLHIVYMDDDGNSTRVSDSIYDANNQRIIFITNHFSVYGVGYTVPKAKFTDIDTHWAKNSIDYVVGRDLLSGTKKTTFSPNKAITREMFVSALGKLAGIDTKEYTKNSFSDVKADSSFRPYIEWAYSEGIIQGISSKKFGPKRSITRQEIAVIMANYAKAMGYHLPSTRNAIVFKDASSIGKKYADAVKSMQQAGIMMGKSDNKFNPKAVATRAEVSAMLHRFVMLSIDL